MTQQFKKFNELKAKRYKKKKKKTWEFYSQTVKNQKQREKS